MSCITFFRIQSWQHGYIAQWLMVLAFHCWHVIWILYKHYDRRLLRRHFLYATYLGLKSIHIACMANYITLFFVLQVPTLVDKMVAGGTPNRRVSAGTTDNLTALLKRPWDATVALTSFQRPVSWESTLWDVHNQIYCRFYRSLLKPTSSKSSNSILKVCYQNWTNLRALLTSLS